MSDITSIAPYEPVTIQDTTDENRTDLVALLQRQENEIALQNQVIRQILQHWDSISPFELFNVSRVEIGCSIENDLGWINLHAVNDQRECHITVPKL